MASLHPIESFSDASSKTGQISKRLQPIDEDLRQLKDNLRLLLKSETKTQDVILDHIFASSGKFIRPSLFFLSCDLFGYQGPFRASIACVCEYIHQASLLHDDVIDNSVLRRNKPCANRIWGDVSAILLGDLIYARASELMAQSGELKLVECFARSIRKMSEGELLQLEHSFNLQIGQELYFTILSAKTGCLMGACCEAAGILAGANANVLAALNKFGHSVGIAFQMIDDALDFTSDAQTLGKNVAADLLEGKVTLPVLLVWEQASAEEKERLGSLFEPSVDLVLEAQWVSSLVKRYGAAEETIRLASQKTTEAIFVLEQHVAQSQSREDLVSLVKLLLTRVR